MPLNDENWRTTDLNVDSLWLIDKRDNSGKHENNYHGNFIPQIPNQLIRRYTKKGETVLELFTGSGTTLFECEKLGRNYIGFDINSQMINYINQKMADCNSIHYSLNECDVTDAEKINRTLRQQFNWTDKGKANFLIAHPPYLDIVKFTDKTEDLSNITDLNLFIERFTQAMANGLYYLERNRYFAIVVGDIYKKSEVIPLGFYLMYAIKKTFKVKMKGIIVKNIEGNRGKLGSQGIWKYRALNSDYYLFKHEYIFVFKKEF
jgi:DNA modification methylase